MYFDVVLNGKKPIFNDTPEEVRDFLERISVLEDLTNWTVVPGDTLDPMSIDDYLAMP
jgi:hypothetical protein